jgi:hypothetical protein
VAALGFAVTASVFVFRFNNLVAAPERLSDNPDTMPYKALRREAQMKVSPGSWDDLTDFLARPRAGVRVCRAEATRTEFSR